MIRDIGIDIIEISRIKKAIEKNSRFIKRVFTSAEIEYFVSKNNAPNTIAGYFAAKEAVAKALGQGFSNIKWKDIEILKDQRGKPLIKLYNNAQKIAYSKNISHILVSISHSKDNAIAQAVAVFE
ncbi:holo-ACP synthase [Serpentinicella sp. ANB-PHB4]|uniref:holo-ACP synthase n=1 Tax=Serpentinicella sp. ANB-PHB4 TaxID=3074076 RepID=UPI002862E7E2|nr:holo-ACP synthase [Serpentinicella sp. ANB-PHB4]MDR5659349.1 holo-ACP synthase [Serpentinicella sp. ANB-PHB4]